MAGHGMTYYQASLPDDSIRVYPPFFTGASPRTPKVYRFDHQGRYHNEEYAGVDDTHALNKAG